MVVIRAREPALSAAGHPGTACRPPVTCAAAIAYPAGGAGVFDVDPDQTGLSQDPDHAVTSDIEALDDDWEL
ncbi:hypothetical protein [Streptomyces sp. NPDC048106]|uniref:hypothetical protein n=1 Tax=Streptomyces sp. NPDC048106 TaxID=3155750 RepID=UPI00345620FF